MQTIAKLLVGLGLDARDYAGGIDVATRHTRSFVDSASSSFDGFSRIGTGALMRIGELAVDTAMRVAGALGHEIVEAGKLVGSYQQNMAVLQTVTGATGQDMADFATRAKELGADLLLPGASAADAAAVMLELGKAGLSVKDTLAAAKGAMQLSAAGLNDNAKAAEIAANALNAFHLEGDRAGFVVDLLAGAANRSSVDIKDVSDSFRMASAVYSAFQGPVVDAEKSMIDLTTAIALLGNAGIKGSDAGTSLKQMLLQLTGPSNKAKEQMRGLMYAAQGATVGMGDFDKLLMGDSGDRSEVLQSLAAGNPALGELGDIAYTAAGAMRPLQEIINLTAAATKNMTDEQRNKAVTDIFGADAARAMIILMNQEAGAFDEMSASISRQGHASETAAAMNSGLIGAFDGLKSAYETTQLTLGEPLAEPVERGIKLLAEAVNAATPMLLDFVVSYILPAMNAVVDFLDAFVHAPDKVQFLIDAVMSVYNSVMEWILSKRDEWVTTALEWLDYLKTEGTKKFDEYSKFAIDKLTEGYKAIMQYIEDHKEEWGNKALEWLTKASELAQAKVLEITPKIVDAILTMLPDIIKAGGDLADAAINWLAGEQPEVTKNSNELFDKIGVSFEANHPKIEEAATKVSQKLAKSLVDKGIPALGVAVVDLIRGFGELLIEKGTAANEPGTFGRVINDAIYASINPFILYEQGKEVIKGFIDGIKWQWDESIKVITGLWDQLPQGIKDTLAMHSPSKLMGDLGKQAVGSFINGALSLTESARSAAESIGSALIPSVQPMALSSVPVASQGNVASGTNDASTSQGQVINNYYTIEGSVIRETELMEKTRNFITRKDKDTRRL